MEKEEEVCIKHEIKTELMLATKHSLVIFNEIKKQNKCLPDSLKRVIFDNIFKNVLNDIQKERKAAAVRDEFVNYLQEIGNTTQAVINGQEVLDLRNMDEKEVEEEE